MNFKTKEDLYQEEIDDVDTSVLSFNCGLDEAFKSFAERIVFCKKYRYMPHLLETDESDIYDQWTRYANKNLIESNWTLDAFIPCEFEDWFFDYCLGDVLNG